MVTCLTLSLLLGSILNPDACRWCEHNALDDDATHALALKDPRPIAMTSNVVAYYALPALALGGLMLAPGKDRLREVPGNLLAVGGAIAGSMIVNEAVKASVARERPDGSDNLSFYSGHTSSAFAIVAGLATVAHLRGYKAEPWIWSVGLPVAGFVGWSRIAARRHYLSDVLVGAAMGAAFGLLAPRIFLPARAAARAG